MATDIVLSNGSLMIDNPIVYRVTAETIATRATFHRLHLKVRASLSTDGVVHTYIFTSPVDNGGSVDIDISIALRSVAQQYDYTPITTAAVTYPYITYVVTAWDEYMLDGIPYTEQSVRHYGGTPWALMGGFSDVERMAAGATKTTQKFSRKPSTGEVIAQNELLCYPTPYATAKGVADSVSAGPTVTPRSMATLSGAQTHDGHTVYVVPAHSQRYSFQFVNSLGVVESISCQCLPSFATEREAEEHVVTRGGSFHQFSRYVNRIGKSRKVLNLSTGPITEEWADWWIHEFLTATTVWIYLDSRWLPCTITADDTLEGTDRASPALVEVLFSAKLNINGSTKVRV